MASRGESLSPEQRGLSEDRVDHLLAQYSAATSLQTGQTSLQSGQTSLQSGQSSSRGRSSHSSRVSPQREVPHLLHPPTASRPLHPHRQRWSAGATGSVLASSWSAIPTAINGGSPDPVEDTSNSPTAAEIMDILRDKTAILSGGRDRQGQSIITFPEQPKNFEFDRDSIRKVVQYLACIPTEDVRDYGFSVIVDGRMFNWSSIKVILRSLQEALPGQINVVYTVQPGQFWQKKQSSRGHSKEKGKLEFSVVKLSSVDKLIRHVESSQLTSDLGGFLPYNHDLWIKLRLDLEHFISSFNALMEHTSHVEQQLVADQDPSSVEVAEECLSRLVLMQDQLRKAPQNSIREGNELLRALEQGRNEAGTSGMTPDKINAQSIIRKLLDKIGQRQVQLDDLWRERKVALEQTLQLRVFEKSMLKVRFWLKSRAEEQLTTHCDIATGVDGVKVLLEQHDKFEAKSRHHHNALTQLRRMADRFSGDQFESADSLQRQVSKLTARFSKFEGQLDERNKILQGSLRLHTAMKEWRALCQVTSELLKQEMSTADRTPSSVELLSNHDDHLAQLWQVADTALSECSEIMTLMNGVSQKTPAEGGKGAGPGYTPGMDHVSRLMEEVENHRKRVGQLAEARKLQAEELKRLHSCERDAQQVTQWLSDMLTQQLLRNHGDIGDGLSAVDKLLTAHNKFSENAKKTYKYGCDLVSAAQRTRQSCQLDPQPSSSLLSNMDTTWRQLSEAIGEVKGQLEAAKEFHSLSEESLSNYSEWNTPIHQLPKTPKLIEDKIADMTENKDKLLEKMRRAIDIGKSLADRLTRPLTSDRQTDPINELLKCSLAFLRGRLEELNHSSTELTTSLPQQIHLLKDFHLYCQFEQNIEKVLLWLQEYGLKQMHAFTHVQEGQRSIQAQMESFDAFHQECKGHTIQVLKLHEQSSDVDARIVGFKSDLVKKTTSLKAVWDKFSKRMDDRRAVISLAAGFYDNVEKFKAVSKELKASLSTVDSSSILNILEATKVSFDKAYQEAISEGEKLLTRFTQPHSDQGEAVRRLTSLMEDLKKQKSHIESLWSGAKELPDKTVEVKVQSTTPNVVMGSKTNDEAKTVVGTIKNGADKSHAPQKDVRNGVVSKLDIPEEMSTKPHPLANGEARVSKKYTNKYGELEEEAYKHLEELETKCDHFLSSHTHFRDSPDGAKLLTSDYNAFMLTFDPMSTKLESVLNDLSSLCPKVPPLAPAIRQLCTSVSDRVTSRRASLKQRTNVLDKYKQFCELYKEVDCDLRTLDEFLCQPVDDSVAMETLGTNKVVIDRLRENYPYTKTLGEEFLELTSEMLTSRGGPKLEVGGVCTSVAVDLGDLEGRYPDVSDRWDAREKELTQQMDWQSFKTNYDQITTWLKESAGMFLATRIDVGTSLETAEDLLMELGEFDIRAKRTANEVQSLLIQSESMLAGGVRESSELSDLAWDLRAVHDDFDKQLHARSTSLKDAVSFFMTSDQVRNDMQKAVDSCGSLLVQDLPTHLKITSISTRLVNLQHQGSKLLENLGLQPPTPDHTHKKKGKSRARRTESASASELAIKQLLAKLQRDFNDYKKAVERRIISPSPQPVISPRELKSPSPGEVAIKRRKSDLKSPPPKFLEERNQKVNERRGQDKTDKTGLKRQVNKQSSLDVQSVKELVPPATRVRANTGEATKAKRRISAVKQLVVALNQQSTKEDASALKEIGTSFGHRPRAHTADPSVNTTKVKTPDLPRKNLSPTVKDGLDVKDSQQPSQSGVVLRRRSPTSVDTVPLRRRGGGVSRAERREKINAIRQIFESASADSAKTADKMDKKDKVQSSNPPVTKETSKELTPTDTSEEKQNIHPAEEETRTCPSPTILISPPPLGGRERLHTTPTVCRAVLKDTLPAKKRIITVNVEPVQQEKPVSPEPVPLPLVTVDTQAELPDTTDLPVAPSRTTPTSDSAHLRMVRATRSASPQAVQRIQTTPTHKAGFSSNESSPVRRASRRPPPLRVSGKVSSLRNMFDSQAKITSPGPIPSPKSHSSSVQSPGMERSHKGTHRLSAGFEPQEALLEASNECDYSLVDRRHSPDITPKVDPTPVDSTDWASEEQIPHVKSTVPPPEDLLHVPRPLSPVGRTLEEDSDSSGSETSEFEFSSDESVTSSSGEEDFDGPWEEPDSARMRKSMSAVLSELIQSELVYSRSLELLATIYLPMLDERRVPTFLQGRKLSIFSNLQEIYTFHRQFTSDLCHHGDSIEEVCNAFTRNGPGFVCYLPFLVNMSRGLSILSEYGGSFFEDKQQRIGDDVPITSHYCRLKERLVEYDHHLRELYMCAQKEALHAVSDVKDALKTIQKLLRDIDNTIALNALRGCPHSLTADHMIRQDLFQAYTTRGKKKIKEYHVFLTPEFVLFSRTKQEKSGTVHYDFTESLKIAELHLLETYKSHDDTFALCEGKLSSDNLRVLTPLSTPLLMKTVWLQEIRPLLQKKHSRRVTVGEEDTPLPYCFRGNQMPRPQPLVTQALEEREGWFGSLRRGKSIRGSMKRTGSLRKKRRPTKELGEKESVKRSHSFSGRKRDAVTGGHHQEKGGPQTEDTLSRHSQLSSASGRGAPSGPLPVQDDDMYVVVEPFSSTRDGFLTVEIGQLVEVLDNSGKTWMVLTVARSHGELEMEGFLPASCLRPASHDDLRPTVSTATSHASHSSAISHDRSHDHFEAETGQEVPPNGVSGASNLTTPSTSDVQPAKSTPYSPDDHTPLDHNHSESTGQNLSHSITIVPADNNHHGNRESPTQIAESAPKTEEKNSSKRIKPPSLDLTSATPTDEINEERPSIGSKQFDNTIYQEHGPNAAYLSPMFVGRKLGDYSHPVGVGLTSSLRSLPSTFSPVTTPRTMHKYLGYDPMQIPEVTLSYPELGPPAPPTERRKKAREELSKLRQATVQHAEDIVPGSVDEFDPVNVYVAIADFIAAEESSISLAAGQCVEVLDDSRSDWWLVVSTDSGREGWVPACYLEQQTLTDPSSPPPEPFEDETGELARLMMRSESPSDFSVNRLQLYKSSFLLRHGRNTPEEPSEAQLQGMFSIAHPYVAVTEIQAELPGQLSLIRDQPVSVVDSRRDDWWLVRTIPEGKDASPPVEGWVPTALLHLDENIREDSVAETTSLATITSAFEETSVGSAVNIQSSRPQAIVNRRSLGGHVSGSPSSAPLWVVLADYEATESGMLTVQNGDLVEVLDISRNEWCLIRTNARPLEEGWVPMGYLKPYSAQGYANPSLLPPRFHQHSSSSDSDTPTESSDRSSVAFSPEGFIEAVNEEARTEAKERRRCVVSELAKTERDYVEKLQFCLENYYPLSEESSVPKPTQSIQDTLFGNLADIYNFHKEHFLPELMACEIDPLKLGDTFVACEDQLRMYVTYCKNKAKSDDIYHEYSNYFDERKAHLKDRLELADYLIMPVQRITKYTLLLHDFHKYSVRSGLEAGSILSSLEVSRGVSSLANNAIHLSLLEERVNRAELGELVMQDLFGSQEGQKQLYKERRIFLFENALIITKRRRDTGDKEKYFIKEQLMLRDISMTQDMDPNRLNIITYDMLTGTKFILRAPKTSVRDTWLNKTNILIRTAKQTAANNLSSRNRSSSEPNEYLSRTPSFSRRSMFRREGSSKRKSLKRPHSSSGVRGTSLSPDEQEPPGTEYVVMECIVMEGGDDVTLEPGEVVQLVRVVPGGGVLRVRTVDDPPIEGKIPTSYLRKKDAVKGLKMEAIPKFTMTPSDMDLLAGSTATISCAFNGFPVPSIIWRKDQEHLTGDGDRWRITSCPTSSVLEVTRLEYGDEGCYSCYITNSMGSDSADMVLTIHGPPSQPPKPTASKITSSSVKLKWSPPDNDGTSLIHSYQVEMLQEGFDTWQPIIQQPRNHFMVKSLLPNTSYQFRVIAYNEYGASEASESTKVVMGTRGRWQSFRRGNVPQITVDSANDSIDGPYDDLGTDDNNLSPHQNIRRGSISNAFDIMPDELGRGRFGIVHRCVSKRSGVQLAAKYVRLRSKRKSAIRKEVDILLKIKGKSPNFIEFCDAFERGRNLIIVTELIPDGELIERIIADNDLTEGVAVGYLLQLLTAVECLHQLNIAHLDIRPENLLLNGDTLKLIDFGSAKEMTSDLTPVYTSSVEFAAPEILNGDLPSLSSDLWSVGVVTYVLLSGNSPFFADNIQEIVERIKEARYSFYHHQFEQVSQEAKEFISALLQKSPEYRMSAPQALAHPWVKTLERIGTRDRATSPWPMARLDVSGLKTFNARRKWHTMSVAVDDTTVFGPRSMICLSPVPPDFEEMAKNESPPHLWDGQTELQVRVGSKVTISYSFAGNPEPTVIWEHEDLEVQSSRRHVIKTSGGVTSVCVTDVRREDEGMYACTALNGLGSVAQECHVTVMDVPGPPSDVNGVILGTYNSAMVSWLSPVDTGNSPIVSYVLQKRQLQFDFWEDVASISDSTAHVVEDLVPGVTYMFRVSAVNEVGVGGYSKPSGPVAIVKDRGYDSDSPTPDEVHLKLSSFEIEYEKGEDIWRGNFTAVIQCRERTTDRLFAAKLISTQNLPEAKERALAEFEMHCHLSHPRLVNLEDAFLSDDHVTLVMEFLSGGTLQDLLSSQQLLEESVSSRYIRKITEGLQYLHEAKIILVNLSPDNILLTAGHNDLKICDFGLSRFIESVNQLTSLEGRVEFMSPEAVTLQPLTTAADIWSVGTIAYLMLTNHSPFSGPTQEATITNIASLRLDTDSAPYSALSNDARDFIQYRALVRNPRRRLTAIQCQRHRWLQSRSSRRSSVDQPLDSDRRMSLDSRRGSADKLRPPRRNSGSIQTVNGSSKRMSLS